MIEFVDLFEGYTPREIEELCAQAGCDLEADSAGAVFGKVNALLESRLAEELEFVLKGGPGSGHHGHAGRPGEHGGSAPSLAVYHGTSFEAFQSIYEEGIVAGSYANWPASKSDLVYVSESFKSARFFGNIAAEKKLGSRDTQRYVIVEAEIPRGMLRRDPHPEAEYFKAWVVEKKIPKDLFRKAYIMKWDKEKKQFSVGETIAFSEKEISVRMFVPLAIEEFEGLAGEKGGPGSGHYGHTGRPGQVGGSAPGTALRGVDRHVWERAGQRARYQLIKTAIRHLTENAVLPESPDQSWHLPMMFLGKLAGILVGNDARATTVLAPTMEPYPGSELVTFSSAKGGPGSGHHGHEGRPGRHGGSLPGPGKDGELRVKAAELLMAGTGRGADEIILEGRLRIARQIPDSHVEGIPEIVEDARAARAYGREVGSTVWGMYIAEGSFRGYAEGSIVMNDYGAGQILAHEIGHHVYESRVASNAEWRQQLRGEYRKFGEMSRREQAGTYASGIRDMAAKSSNEFFSDAYMVWVSHKVGGYGGKSENWVRELRKEYPATAGILDELFGG